MLSYMNRHLPRIGRLRAALAVAVLALGAVVATAATPATATPQSYQTIGKGGDSCTAPSVSQIGAPRDRKAPRASELRLQLCGCSSAAEVEHFCGEAGCTPCDAGKSGVVWG